MMFNPSDHQDPVLSIKPDARGTGTVNGTSIDCRGHDYLAVFAQVGDAATSATLDVKLQSSSDDGVADAFADITGATVPQFTGSDDATMKSLEHRLRPTERYVRAVGVLSGNVDYSVVLVANGTKQTPDNIAATWTKS